MDDEREQTFRVTHPFHPWLGREYELVSYRQAWGEHRVYFHDEQGQLRAFPVDWTSMAPVDPFRMVSNGRSWFRVVDLVEMSGLFKRWEEVV